MKTHSKKSVNKVDQTPVSSDALSHVQPALPEDKQPSITVKLMSEGMLFESPEHPAATSDNTTLTTEEDKKLKECEAVIEKNKDSFVETCEAFWVIWSKQLYRDHYKSFKQYCEEKWNFTRGYGYRLVNHAETIKKVSTIVNISDLVSNGNQINELSKVPKENLPAVVENAKKMAGKGKVTGQHIKQAAKEEAKEAPQDTALEPVVEQDKAEPVDTYHPPSVINRIVKPSEFFPNAKLLKLVELSEMAEKLYNIYHNSARRKDVDILLSQLKMHLSSYAKWEEATSGAGQGKEAA